MKYQRRFNLKNVVPVQPSQDYEGYMRLYMQKYRQLKRGNQC